MNARILIVDDEPAVRRFLRSCLQARDYELEEADTGAAALELTRSWRPDLVILDLGLPDLDGLEVTTILREWTRVPILILSVREQESVKVAALDAGADDYLTKPFGTAELLARIRVALRHATAPAEESVFVSGALRVDMVGRTVELAGAEVSLTPTEYDLLRCFIRNAGKVLTHRQLLRTVWGEEYGDDLHLLRVNISNLRRKIEEEPSRPQLVATEPGVGYRLRVVRD